MYKDAIVEEVRTIRDDYARQFAYDLHAICVDLRKDPRDAGRPTIRLRPKRVRSSRKPSQNRAPV